jgi:hypothetical protein
MKAIKFISFFAITIIFIVACNNNDNSPLKNDSKVNTKPHITHQKMLFKGSSKYALLLNDTANIVGYIADKQTISEQVYFSFYDIETLYSDKLDTTRKSFLQINGLTENELSVQTNFSKVKSEAKSLFGTEVTFNMKNENLENNRLMKSPSAEHLGVTMYVPNLVEITFPKQETEQESTAMFCYYNNFILHWNADKNNENGLVVMVEWTGEDMYGYYHNEFVRNVDILKSDNGEALLNSELFDCIPQGAIVKLHLIRGNIETLNHLAEYDNKELYNIVAAVKSTLKFILIRDFE